MITILSFMTIKLDKLRVQDILNLINPTTKTHNARPMLKSYMMFITHKLNKRVRNKNYNNAPFYQRQLLLLRPSQVIIIFFLQLSIILLLLYKNLISIHDNILKVIN